MLVVVIKKKKKRKYDFARQPSPIALNPVYGVKEDEKKGKLYDDEKKDYHIYDNIYDDEKKDYHIYDNVPEIND